MLQQLIFHCQNIICIFQFLVQPVLIAFIGCEKGISCL